MESERRTTVGVMTGTETTVWMNELDEGVKPARCATVETE
jgi:hypothetical protein